MTIEMFGSGTQRINVSGHIVLIWQISATHCDDRGNDDGKGEQDESSSPVQHHGQLQPLCLDLLLVPRVLELIDQSL